MTSREKTGLFTLDEARPDYVYGYGDALRDGRVVRPVYFPRVGGDMEWVAPDGTETTPARHTAPPTLDQHGESVRAWLTEAGAGATPGA